MGIGYDVRSVKMQADAAVDLETGLRRVVVGYRAAGVVWMLLLVVVSDLPDGLAPRLLGAGMVALAATWALLTALLGGTRPEALRSWAWLATDVAIACAVVLGPFAVAAATSSTTGAVTSFAGGYPFSAVLLGGWTRGVAGGLVAAVGLSAATVAGDVAARGGWTVQEALPATLVYLAGALVTAWGVRLLRRQDAERREALLALAEERVATERERERAETAAHLHDSVLQTLALVQRRAEEPATVRALARDQERALRRWLSGDGERNGSVASVLAERCAEVERDYGIRVEVVTTGDRPLDEPVGALLAAAAEAVRNAARHSGAPEVSVYAELGDEPVVFVRDRGCGFDPAAVPADRRGIAESVRARLERHGGVAVLHTAPGRGVEWELRLGERRAT